MRAPRQGKQAQLTKHEGKLGGLSALDADNLSRPYPVSVTGLTGANPLTLAQNTQTVQGFMSSAGQAAAGFMSGYLHWALHWAGTPPAAQCGQACRPSSQKRRYCH